MEEKLFLKAFQLNISAKRASQTFQIPCIQNLVDHINNFLFKTQSKQQMILKMISQTELTKQDRNKFIPFVNQRDHMGQIIKNKQKDKQYLKSIDVFQNLKKTTKQYFFDKKYQKMKQKLSRCKLSMQSKQPNYDREVGRFVKTLQKSAFLKSKMIDPNRSINSDTFFVDLNQRLNEKINTLKSQIHKNYNSRVLRPKKFEAKNKTFHGDGLKIRKFKETCGYMMRKNSGKQNFNLTVDQDLKKKTIKTPKKEDTLCEDKIITSVNREIFKDLSKQSQKMVDFTNFGLKYKHTIKAERKDPWKKWYADYRVEIFPGEVIKLKKLQKSIYE